MSKFLAVDSRLINTSSITNIILNKKSLSFTIKLADDKGFKKTYENEEDFMKAYQLLSKDLDVVNLNLDDVTMFDTPNLYENI